MLVNTSILLFKLVLFCFLKLTHDGLELLCNFEL